MHHLFLTVVAYEIALWSYMLCDVMEDAGSCSAVVIGYLMKSISPYMELEQTW